MSQVDNKKVNNYSKIKLAKDEEKPVNQSGEQNIRSKKKINS